MSFKFIVRVENNGINKFFPDEFLLPLKKIQKISEFDIESIIKIIREKYIEKDSNLSGKMFYIQEINYNKFGEIRKIGRIYA